MGEGVDGGCLLHFTLPVVDVVKWLVVGDVIDNDGSMRSSEVGLQYNHELSVIEQVNSNHKKYNNTEWYYCMQGN